MIERSAEKWAIAALLIAVAFLAGCDDDESGEATVSAVEELEDSSNVSIYDEPITVPLEIKNSSTLPPYRFEDVESWGLEFYTDLSIVQDLLPPPLEPADVNGDWALVSVSFLQYPGTVTTAGGEGPNLRNYDEMVFSIPALYGSEVGSFMTQLYLGSIEPESAVAPTVAGLNVFGYPKRAGIFTHSENGIGVTSVNGADIVYAELSAGGGLVYDDYETGVGGTTFFLKYVPGGEEDAEPDVLKLQKISNGFVQLKAVAPMSLLMTFDLVRESRSMPGLASALVREYRFVSRSMEYADILEGIRAAIIDKDRDPQWKYPSMAVVPPDLISRLKDEAPGGDPVFHSQQRES